MRLVEGEVLAREDQDPAANAGAARCCRSLQLERRLYALEPTPAMQPQRNLTLTQRTRREDG